MNRLPAADWFPLTIIAQIKQDTKNNKLKPNRFSKLLFSLLFNMRKIKQPRELIRTDKYNKSFCQMVAESPDTKTPKMRTVQE